MSKKMREKDGQKRENKQIEEGNSAEKEIDVLNMSTENKNRVPKSSNRVNDKNEKEDHRIKRKAELDTDIKEYQKVHKKHKKSKDVVEVKEISKEISLGGKEITEQEGIEAINLENNGEAKWARKGKHKKQKDVIDAVATVAETLEHSKVQETVEVQKICFPGDSNKMVHGKEEAYKKRKKKQKLEKVNGDVGDDIEVMSSRAGENVKNATPKDKSKKVSFCDQVEVFPHTGVTDNANKDGKEGPVKDGKEGLVYGKRYSREEDELVMNAVAEYIESHNLGDEGLNMVLNCGAHSEVRNCWKEIQAAIPWRPLNSVYHRAHILFERDEKHPWTPEELEIVQKFVEKHGRKWTLLGESLGKHRHHVKDTWRRIKLTNANKGRWSQEEYQNLFDLVNLDLSMKASQERLFKYGMLRDNICWTAISDKMETRPFVSCCIQWYRKLTSPMVAEGIWADADDYRMLDSLSSLDSCCMEDVDWDNLLENRSGDLCRKRWGQMVRHLDPNKDMSFAEQVDVLANRYRPDMVEARETYDSKRPMDLP